MNRESFEQGFNKLAQAFNVSKLEDKARIYFTFLEKIPEKSFTEIIDIWIRTESRFPAISDILAQFHGKTGPATSQKASCNTCDGYGWVKIGYKAYRGDCYHGSRLSKNIKIGPPKDKRTIELENQKNELIETYGETHAKQLFGGQK